MASEHIDELLVGLGLDTDEQSFQRGMSAFAGIRSAALSAAGAIGVGFSATTLVRFAGDMHSARIEAERLGTSVGYLTQLDDAFRQAGASGADATGELGNMARLLDEFRFNTGGAAFNLAAQVGLDPSAIADADNVMQAYETLIDRASNLGAQERRVALGSLGFGTGTEALSQAGTGQMAEWMAMSERLAGVTDEMVQESIEFNQELGELTTGIEGLTNAIVSDMIPELTKFVRMINEWLGEEGRIENIADMVNEGPEGLGRRASEATNRWITDRLPGWLQQYDWEPFSIGGDDEDRERSNIDNSYLDQSSIDNSHLDQSNIDNSYLDQSSIDNSHLDQSSANSLLEDSDFVAEMSATERRLGVPRGTLWQLAQQESSLNPNAVSETGAQGLFQILPSTERLFERREGEDYDPFDPMDALELAEMHLRDDLAREGGDLADALRAYNAGPDWRTSRNPWADQNFSENVLNQPVPPQASNVTFNITGANDPQEVARVVDQRLRSVSMRTAEDYRSSLV